MNQVDPEPPGFKQEYANQAPPAYSAPAPGYGAPPQGYGAPPPGYGAPPPGYGNSYGGHTQSVVITQPTVQPHVIMAPPKPDDYMIMSIIVLLCCNLIFGFIAFICSMQSKSSYESGNYDDAREKGRMAFRINVAGIICTIASVIIGVITYIIIWAVILSSLAAASGP